MKGGKFYVTRQLINGELDEIAVFFKLIGFVPIRVEFLVERDVFEYIGYSVLFDDIPIGNKYPIGDW